MCRDAALYAMQSDPENAHSGWSWNYLVLPVNEGPAAGEDVETIQESERRERQAQIDRERGGEREREREIESQADISTYRQTETHTQRERGDTSVYLRVYRCIIKNCLLLTLMLHTWVPPINCIFSPFVFLRQFHAQILTARSKTPSSTSRRKCWGFTPTTSFLGKAAADSGTPGHTARVRTQLLAGLLTC